MASDPKKPASAPAAAGEPADPRRERLARALRDNLKKRKAQQRQRRAGAAATRRDGDDGPGGGA